MSQQAINQASKLLVLGFALSIGTGCEIDLSDLLDNGGDAVESRAVATDVDGTEDADAEPTDNGTIDPTNVEEAEEEGADTYEPVRNGKKVVVIGWDYFEKVNNRDLLLDSNVDFDTLPNGDNGTTPDPQCQIEILGDYEAVPGETIDIEWEMTGDPIPEVHISIGELFPAPGSGGSQHYYSTVVPNTGNFQWELPEDLDPTLNYNIYLESADEGQSTTICWRYADLVVLEPEPEQCDVDILGTYEAAPGETIDIEWEMTGDVSPDVLISIHSGGGSQHYLNTIVPNTGHLQWELPEDLDPTLDYNIYVQSADGLPTSICWRYTDLVILP